MGLKILPFLHSLFLLLAFTSQELSARVESEYIFNIDSIYSKSILVFTDVPIAVSDSFYCVEDDSVFIDLLVNDIDNDDNGLELFIYIAPLNGTLSTIDLANKMYYHPDTDFCGTDSFRYIISDLENDRDTSWCYIDILCVNDPPVARDDTFRITEDDATHVLNVSSNDFDTDNETLFIINLEGTQKGTLELMFNEIQYTLHPDSFGVDSFLYVIVDSDGDRDTGRVVVLIDAVNDPPIAVDDEYIMREDHDLYLELLLNDIDVDKTGIYCDSIYPQPHGSVTKIGDSLLYRPVENYHGRDTFSYRLVDGDGDVDEAVVYITIQPVADGPIAVSDTIELFGSMVVAPDQFTFFDPIANDLDPDNAGIEFVKVSVLPVNGTYIYYFGQKVYRPNSAYYGLDSLSYDIKDGNGGVSTGKVFFIIHHTDIFPLALNDDFEVIEDVSTIYTPTINNNDDEILIPLYLDILEYPEYGSLVIEESELRYTPDANYWGPDTFVYIANDTAYERTDTASVYVTVLADDDAPQVIPIMRDIYADDVDTIDVLAMVENFDDNGIYLALLIPGLGKLTVENDLLIYTPPFNYTGVDLMYYTVVDGDGSQSGGSISFNVMPVTGADTFEIFVNTVEDSIVFFALEDERLDSSNVGRVIVVEESVLGGCILDRLEVEYVPNLNLWGEDTIIYCLKDTSGELSDIVNVYITIDSVNESPTALDSTFYILENNSDTVDISDLFVDNDFSSITFYDVAKGHNSSIEMYGREVIITPDIHFDDFDSLYYFIKDGEGDTARGTLFIDVIPDTISPIIEIGSDTIHYIENSGAMNVLHDLQILGIDSLVRIEVLVTNDSCFCFEFVSDYSSVDITMSVDTIPNGLHYNFVSDGGAIDSWEHILQSFYYTDENEFNIGFTQISFVLWDSEGAYPDNSSLHIIQELYNDSPVNTRIPLISGIFLPDSILECDSGLWYDIDGSLSYCFDWVYSKNNIEKQLTSSCSSQLIVDDSIMNCDALWCTLSVTDDGYPVPVQTVTINSDSVIPANYPPSALTISENSIYKSTVHGAVIGSFSATDRDVGQEHTYELLTGLNVLSIVGDTLYLDTVAMDLGFQQITISVRVHDSGDVSLYNDFDLTLVMVNDLMPIMEALYPQIHEIQADSVLMSVKANKPGTAVCIVIGEKDPIPVYDVDLFKDTVVLDEDTPSILSAGDLDYETDYKMVIYLVDTLRANRSGPYFKSFRTLDITPPEFIYPTPWVLQCSPDSISVRLQLNELGVVHCAVIQNETLTSFEPIGVNSEVILHDELIIADTSNAAYFVVNELESRTHYNLMFYAIDTSGNISDTIYDYCEIPDTIAPLWEDGFPKLKGVIGGEIYYSVKFNECDILFARLCTNYAPIADFSVPDPECGYDVLLDVENDSCFLDTTFNGDHLDGVYRLDLAMMDSAGNMSEIRSLGISYARDLIVRLKSSIIYSADNLVLLDLDYDVDYCIINVSGGIEASGGITPVGNVVSNDDIAYTETIIELPHLGDGIYFLIIKGATESATLRFLKYDSSTP